MTALRDAGIEPVLLKGPAVARWLYAGDPDARPYGDVDLLVAPHDRDRAQTILLELGYEPRGEPMPELDEPHSRWFKRPADNAEVDLHRVLHGMEHVPEERVWRAVGAGTDAIRVAGVEVAIPSEPVRTLHLALHLTPLDRPGSRAWGDLLRGIAQLDRRTWEDAAQVARALGIAGEMGHRLSLVPEGAELGRALGLPSEETDLYAALRVGHAGSYPAGVISLLQLSAKRDARERAAYVREKLLPPADLLRERHAFARRGPLALALVRAQRVAWCVAALPGAVRVWRRERSGTAGERR